jgi:hypothetical protein
MMQTQPDGDLVRQVLLESFRATISDRQAIYVSGPLTTGRRFLEWLKSDESSHGFEIDGSVGRASWVRAVLQPNTEHISEVADRVRRETSRVVINPSAFPELPDWSQANWVDFWCEVIRKYVSEVTFVDGWQYSSGCGKEFLVAQQLALEVRNEAGMRITVQQGVRLIAGALQDFVTIQNEPTLLRDVYRELADWRSIVDLVPRR